MVRSFVSGPLVLTALAIASVADGPLKSGPQPGGEVAAFHSLNLTGPVAGQKACQV